MKKQFHFNLSIIIALILIGAFFRFYLMFKYGGQSISETPTWVIYFLR